MNFIQRGSINEQYIYSNVLNVSNKIKHSLLDGYEGVLEIIIPEDSSLEYGLQLNRAKNFIVDWGDGTITKNTYTGYIFFKHAYEKPGLYHVRLPKCAGYEMVIMSSKGAETEYTKMLRRILKWNGEYDKNFANCKNLEYANIQVTNVPREMFSGCTSLKFVDGLDNAEKFGMSCFRYCSSFPSTFIVPENVKSLGNYTLSYAGLQTVIFKGIPISINDSTFSYVKTLTDIYVPWSKGEVAGAPWGATNATIHYNHVL